jgi:hypothetical protein
LATSFQGTSNHATAKGPVIPGTGCHLVVERQYLPSHHCRKLRTRRGRHQLLQYIQHKHRLSDVAMTHINWESHAQAIRNFQVTSTTFLVKFPSKWLPVGKQVHRYNPAVYPSQCPSCSCENEDFNHAFRCPDPQRRKWRSDLRRELLQRLNYLNIDPVLADLLIDGLHHWLLDTPHSPAPRFPQYAPLGVLAGINCFLADGPRYGQHIKHRTFKGGTPPRR